MSDMGSYLPDEIRRIPITQQHDLVVGLLNNGGTVAKNPKKPCDSTCPKCGSDNVYMTLKAVNEPYDTIGYRDHEWIGAPWVKTSPTFGRKYFVKECLRHHCRGCHFEWCSSPLQIAV